MLIVTMVRFVEKTLVPATPKANNIFRINLSSERALRVAYDNQAYKIR